MVGKLYDSKVDDTKICVRILGCGSPWGVHAGQETCVSSAEGACGGERTGFPFGASVGGRKKYDAQVELHEPRKMKGGSVCIKKSTTQESCNCRI